MQRSKRGPEAPASTDPAALAADNARLVQEIAEGRQQRAAIALENARLHSELQVTNASLIAALEQQTATSEILRVISSSPTHVQPVFDTIAESARRLCEADFCGVFRFDGQLLHLATVRGVTGDAAEVWRRAFPVVPDRGSAAGRSVLSATIV